MGLRHLLYHLVFLIALVLRNNVVVLNAILNRLFLERGVRWLEGALRYPALCQQIGILIRREYLTLNRMLLSMLIFYFGGGAFLVVEAAELGDGHEEHDALHFEELYFTFHLHVLFILRERNSFFEAAGDPGVDLSLGTAVPV